MQSFVAIDMASDEEAAQFMTPRASVLELLGTLADPAIRQSFTMLFEHTTPGATDALRAYASTHGLEVVEESAIIGNRRVRRAQLRFPNGSTAEVVAP